MAGVQTVVASRYARGRAFHTLRRRDFEAINASFAILPVFNLYSIKGFRMGSNVIHLADTPGFNASASPFNASALSVPSFRRRPATSQIQSTPPGDHWAVAARKRVALRLIESSVEGAASGSATSPVQAATPPLLQAMPEPSPQQSQQPLRVMRLVEAGQMPGTAGRLRLSGRLADVCAELDRMVAAEPFSTRARRA